MLQQVANVDTSYNMTPEELYAKIAQSDALIVRSATKVRWLSTALRDWNGGDSMDTYVLTWFAQLRRRRSPGKCLRQQRANSKSSAVPEWALTTSILLQPQR